MIFLLVFLFLSSLFVRFIITSGSVAAAMLLLLMFILLLLGWHLVEEGAVLLRQGPGVQPGQVRGQLRFSMTEVKYLKPASWSWLSSMSSLPPTGGFSISWRRLELSCCEVRSTIPGSPGRKLERLSFIFLAAQSGVRRSSGMEQ